MRTRVPTPGVRMKGNTPTRRRPITPNRVAWDIALIKLFISLGIAVAFFYH